MQIYSVNINNIVSSYPSQLHSVTVPRSQIRPDVGIAVVDALQIYAISAQAMLIYPEEPGGRTVRCGVRYRDILD